MGFIFYILFFGVPILFVITLIFHFRKLDKYDGPPSIEAEICSICLDYLEKEIEEKNKEKL